MAVPHRAGPVGGRQKGHARSAGGLLEPERGRRATGLWTVTDAGSADDGKVPTSADHEDTSEPSECHRLAEDR
jgi:hypothetical protein